MNSEQESSLSEIEMQEQILGLSSSDLQAILSTLHEESNHIASATQKAVASLPTNDLTIAIIAAFVGALSAFIFNWCHWKIVNKKEKVNGYCRYLSQLVDELEEVACEYWMDGYNHNSNSKIHLNEAKIKSYLRLSGRIISFICDEAKPYTESHSKLKKLYSDIYDIITGGDFESKFRQPSSEQARKISYLCSEMNIATSEISFKH